MVFLDGKQLVCQIKDELVQKMVVQIVVGGKVFYFVVVLVGDNFVSKVYVCNKVCFCEQVGFYFMLICKFVDIIEVELLYIIEELNQDFGIDGFIVQLLLFDYLDEYKVILVIDFVKDVDGFYFVNIG